MGDLARVESLELYCQVANATGTGIHKKMILVRVGRNGYVHTRSINGSENSSKGNWEFAMQVQSDVAYDNLAQAFWQDWKRFIEHPRICPISPAATRSPRPKSGVRVTALAYDSSDEYVEITNEDNAAQDMPGR